MSQPTNSRNGVFRDANTRDNMRAPKTARLIILTIFGFLAACLWLGASTNVPEVARATGELVPQGGYRQVQSSEGGVVRNVLVAEGQYVAQGQALAVLGSQALTEAQRNIAEELRSARAERANLAALAETLALGKLPDESVAEDLVAQGFVFAASQLAIITAEHSAQRAVTADLHTTVEAQNSALDLARSRLRVREDRLARSQRLHAKGIIALRELDSQQDTLDQLHATILDLEIRVTQTRKELSAARATLERDLLNRRIVLVSDIFDLDQKIEALVVQTETLAQRSAALTITAPEAGIIHQVAYPNSGEVIGAGETIFEILPEASDLIAEIEFDPIDIGHIHTGDAVVLKIGTYDVRRYGHVEGRIESISPNSIFDPQTSREYFRATVHLERETVGAGRWLRDLRAGMVATAEIVTAERTAIAYLAKPISRSLEKAFGER